LSVIGTQAPISGCFEKPRPLGGELHFDGKYHSDVGILEPSLSEKGILGSNLQEEAFRELTGLAYPLFLENAHLVFTGEDLDGFGATVYELGIRGLLGFMGAIVMVGQDGEVWAAVTDGDLVKYFTSEVAGLELPQTVKAWCNRFTGKDLVFMDRDSFEY